MKLIETIKDRCHECYACVRNCPAKAVKVKDGQAEVITDRCIHCGNCVRVCSQGAKKVKDNLSTVRELLDQSPGVIAGLAPSFPSYNPELSLKDWVGLLQAVGFKKVYEVAWGAQLIIEPYKRLLKERDDLIISSACPVIVNLIKKYYPDLLDNLAPVVSPMQALVRYLKAVEGDQDIVLIGPCLAKKAEITDEGVTVLTFSEIATLFDEKEINLKGKINNKNNYKGIRSIQENKNENMGYSRPEDSARRFPLSGGLLKAITDKCDIFPEGFLKVEGSEKVFDLLNSISKQEIRPRFVDILFCEGCINGVDLNNLNYFIKETAVNNFISTGEGNNKVIYSADLARNLSYETFFETDVKELPQPSEGEIWGILNLTGKYQKEDLLNCGACGYSSCREKAVAVYQGLAEVEMCLPYLLSEKRSEIKKVQELNRELDTLINSSYDGMAMVNKDGRIERVNKAFLSMIDLPQDEVLGKNVRELESQRIIYPSVAKLCLHEKREITLIQNTREGQRLLTTASPITDDNNQILRVVVNTRNLTKLNELGRDSREGEKIRQYLQESPEIEFDDNIGHIIYNSSIMKEIMSLAQKVSNTASSVLIMGESGVGKEVIARYIHDHSKDRNSFVKINCAAIPESLLESELFGYETGAFSGAKREGKQGLIERADGGTLFLDEIGEMPLNMQAKLLQVLQEHRVTRIGGVEAIDVNFRLITATNKNLKEMVEKKNFREDLYYRLNVVPIFIPPLRERREDIIPLINYYLKILNKKYDKKIELNRATTGLLYDYDWPGNVRELTNLLERVIITAEEKVIDKEFIKAFMEFEKEAQHRQVVVQDIIPLNEAVNQVEKKLLMMAKEKGKTTYQMAELLGVNQSTIVRKLKKYFN